MEKIDQNKLTILRELVRHVESGKSDAIFMEIQERDTHLVAAAQAMPDAVVVVHKEGKIFLAEKDRFLSEVRHA